MQILDKAKSIGAATVGAVGDIIDRGKDAAHHLVDKVTSVVKGEHHAEMAAEPASVRVAKVRGQKKPRAARRKARRHARASQ